MQNIVETITEKFRSYAESRSTWAQNAQLDREYRYGRHYTNEELAAFELTGRSAAPDNRLHAAVEMGKALMTANSPRYKAVPTGKTDIKSSIVAEALLSYHWRISEGQMHFRTIIDDVYCTGLAYGFTYIDPNADEGRGEVLFEALDCNDVYVDQFSRHPLFDDAEWIIYSRMYTKSQLKRMFPKYRAAIERTTGYSGDDGQGMVPSSMNADYGEVWFPQDVLSVGTIDTTEQVRLYRAFTKEDEYVIFINQTWDGAELELHGKKVNDKMNQRVWLVQGTPIISDRIASETYEGLLSMYQTMMENYQIALQAAMAGQGPDPGEPPEAPTMGEMKYGDLITNGMAKAVKIRKQKVVEYIIAGDVLIDRNVWPIDEYPITPFMVLHTRTPYPMSDVRFARPIQDRMNALDTAILTHTQNSATLKVIYNSASTNAEEFNRQWKSPSVGIGIDMEDGNPPIVIQPAPLAREVYILKNMLSQSIDHQFGLYRLMMGDSEAAPDTNAATVTIDQFGQRKSRSKLSAIETSLARCGQNAFRLMQDLFKIEKVIRVVDKNLNTSEYAINAGLADNLNAEIEGTLNLSNLQYDIQIVAGSTMPDNPTAEIGLYAELFNKGLVDRIEAWKHLGDVDAEGLAKRFSEIEQLKSQLAAMEEENKRLSGDLQTRDREVRHLLDQNQTMKFAGQLDQIKSTVQANATVATARMADAVTAVKGTVSENEKEKASGQAGRSRRRSGRR